MTFHDKITGSFRCPYCDQEFDFPTRRGLVTTASGWPLALCDVYQHTCIYGGPVHAGVLMPFPDAKAFLWQTILKACPPVEWEEAA
jgi:hypothetical protein